MPRPPVPAGDRIAGRLRLPGRRLAWWLLCVLVLLVHGWLADGLARDLIGDGAGDSGRIVRMDVAFLKELAPTVEPLPPAAAAAPLAQVAPARKVPRPARVASAPEVLPEPVSEPPAEPELQPADSVAEAEPPEPEPPSASEPASAVAAAAPASAASAPAPFEWPPSTRLSYRLSGNYRGDIEGSARVEWSRRDLAYQVHLDITVGPSFAPLLTRRMSSEGELGPQGLAPRRYEEQTKQAFRDPRIVAITFERDRILLPRDQVRPTIPGVQDTASQFVQLTYLFRTQPEQLKEGGTIRVPLALARRVDVWLYDVIGREPLDTPFGRLDAWHLKPRRLDKPMGEMSVEMWFAPTLEYLPVRFMIRQDAENYADLLIERLPQQAAER